MTDAELFAKIDMFRDVQDRERFSTVWSIHEVDDIDSKVPLKNQIGRKLVFNYWNRGFKDKQVMTTIKGETWLDMWRAADELIVESGDFHIFIENFVMQEDGSFELICGS
jgi:hypothetical protein